jgi:hypothetical protein
MFCAIFIIKTISTSTWECTPDGIYGMLNKWNEWMNTFLNILYSWISFSMFGTVHITTSATTGYFILLKMVNLGQFLQTILNGVTSGCCRNNFQTPTLCVTTVYGACGILRILTRKGVYHSESLGLWTLPIVWNAKWLEITMFLKLDWG